jgi:hypothetical protein
MESSRVKVAIMDTGLYLCPNTWEMYEDRIVEIRSWLNNEEKVISNSRGSDANGHGTHCTTAFLKHASDQCDVYIAQIFGDTSTNGDGPLEPEDDVGQVAKVRTVH